ncbi:MAG: LysR family transcriptional regulator [Immundisolibacterales bacterium]|nr:LysR family transcriptional regulator [Immundisolibacterales bacterium]
MPREPRMGQGKHDRLRQLRAFCQAARLQSISQAAEQLAVSQPAVSRQVRTLEQELAIVLFERKGPKIALTPAGQRLYEIAMPYVESMDRLPETFSENYRGVAGGQIEIAAGQTTATFLLPRYLKRFRELHPDVRVNLKVASGRQRMSWLRSYEVDIAFVAMDVPPPDVESVALFVSESVLITPSDHPLAGTHDVNLREAIRYPAIAHTTGHYVRHVGEMYLSRHGLTPNIAVEVDGWATIKSYVEAGLGISIVPDLCLTEKDRVWRIPFGRIAPARPYALVRRRDDIFSLASRAFVEVIERCRAEEEG